MLLVGIGLIAMKGAKDQHHPDAIHGLVKRELAGETDLSFHQVAYRFVLDQPGVSGVCIGMGQMRHLEEALVLPKTTLDTSSPSPSTFRAVC